jgi:uncharacterized membrane protein YGL010W
MKTLKQWFVEYNESHQNPTNRIAHKICVPAIFFSIVGLLVRLPMNLGPVHLGELVILAALVWYFTLGFKPFAVMLGQILLCYVLLYAVGQMPHATWILVGIFVLAWLGQFWGHKVEGKKPSFFKDLQFLLIGPLWVVKGVFFKDL